MAIGFHLLGPVGTRTDSNSTLPPAPETAKETGFCKKELGGGGSVGHKVMGEESEFKVILQSREFEASLGYVRPCLKKVPMLSESQFYDLELLL